MSQSYALSLAQQKSNPSATAAKARAISATASFKNSPLKITSNSKLHENLSLKNNLSFVCLFCSESFPKIVAYFKHIRKHDMKQIHKCSICKKIVIDDEQFREHLFVKHKELIDYPNLINTGNIEKEDFEKQEQETQHYNHNTFAKVQSGTAQKMEGFYQNLSKLSYNYYHQFQQLPLAATQTLGPPPPLPPPSQMLSGYVIQQEPPPLVPLPALPPPPPTSQQQQQQQHHLNLSHNVEKPIEQHHHQPHHLHTNNNHPLNNAPEPPTQVKVEPNGYQFKCQFCGEMFSKTTKLTQHLKTHTGGGKLFKCDICDKSYSQSSSLGLHKRKIHYGTHIETHERKIQSRAPKNVQQQQQPSDDVLFDQVFECHSCNKQFSKPSSLKQHYLVHQEIQPYKCEVCGLTFAASSKLLLHKISHTNRQPYKCDFCSKEFAISDHHKRHLRVHTKERPFKCDVCMKTFTQSNTLRQHYRIHTGERPYVCGVCNKNFSVLNYLNNHMRTHQKR